MIAPAIPTQTIISMHMRQTTVTLLRVPHSRVCHVFLCRFNFRHPLNLWLPNACLSILLQRGALRPIFALETVVREITLRERPGYNKNHGKTFIALSRMIGSNV